MSDITFISGGQTGADRAALDWAMENGIAHGGWCPKGRKAEDGRIPKLYNLKETKSADYRERTRLNIQDSDGTLIFSKSPLTNGTKYTMELAKKMGKPVLHMEKGEYSAATDIAKFIRRHKISILNVAGPPASDDPEIYDDVKATLALCYLWSAELGWIGGLNEE